MAADFGFLNKIIQNLPKIGTQAPMPTPIQPIQPPTQDNNNIQKSGVKVDLSNTAPKQSPDFFSKVGDVLKGGVQNLKSLFTPIGTQNYTTPEFQKRVGEQTAVNLKSADQKYKLPSEGPSVGGILKAPAVAGVYRKPVQDFVANDFKINNPVLKTVANLTPPGAQGIEQGVNLVKGMVFGNVKEEQLAKDAEQKIKDGKSLTPEEVKAVSNTRSSNIANIAATSGGIEGVSPESVSSIVPELRSATSDPVQKLIDAVKEAKPLRSQQENLYAQERSARLASFEKAGAGTSGEAGAYTQLSKLKGQLPKVSYESVRGTIGQSDINSLFNMIKDNPTLTGFEKPTAITALSKVLGEHGGGVPTTSELKILDKVYGPEFTKTILDKGSGWSKVGSFVTNALSLPKSIMASLDMSAPFRQGAALVGTKEFWGAFPEMVKSFGSEKVFQAAQQDIVSRPTYSLMKQADLAITEPNPNILSSREEQFLSSWAEKIPGVGKLVRASDRAYTGFLNKLRADTFDRLLTTNPELQNDAGFTNGLARYVNSATGRGDLGSWEKAAEELNGVFFSPRLVKARIDLLNPVYYAKLPAPVRQEALANMGKFLAIQGTIIGLSKLGGAQVETDPRSSDFAKIKIGNTRIDTLGGFQQYVVFLARELSNSTKSTSTGKITKFGVGYKPENRLSTAGKFAQNKLSPVPGYAAGYLSGRNSAGDPFNAGPEALKLFIPLITQDFANLAKDNPNTALPLLLPGFFGANVQNFGDSNTSATTGKHSAF